MNNSLRKVVAGSILAAVLTSSAWGAEIRMATVDLRKVFDGYWKKKQAEAALKDRQADMEKEDRNMVEDYKKVKEEYQSLLAGANEQAISPEERDKRKASAEQRFRRMKEMEENIAQFERNARSTMSEQSQRMRSNILGEIRNVVSGKAKAAGYTLVIDTAAETVNSTPVFLFVNADTDITDAVLTQLNATAPAEGSKIEEKPGSGDKKEPAK
jgi:outer membrane protein